MTKYYKIIFMTMDGTAAFTMYLTARDEAHARQRALEHHHQYNHLGSNPKMVITSFIPAWEKTLEPETANVADAAPA